MTIRIVYRDAAPDFPATDQHPSATRHGPFTVNGVTWFADATGTAPTTQEVADFLNPPAVIAEQARAAAIRADTDRIDLLNQLKTATNAQINTWVDNNVASTNVTTLRNELRVVLKKIIKVIALDART